MRRRTHFKEREIRELRNGGAIFRPETMLRLGIISYVDHVTPLGPQMRLRGPEATPFTAR